MHKPQQVVLGNIRSNLHLLGAAKPGKVPGVHLAIELTSSVQTPRQPCNTITLRVLILGLALNYNDF
jgi:hypothetical protein